MRREWGRRSLLRAALILRAALAGVVLTVTAAAADDAPPAGWPAMRFTREMVDALAARDTIAWTAVPVEEAETVLRLHIASLIRFEVGTKYPCEFLTANLMSVHVVHQLDGGGRAWGGLHWAKRVLLTTGSDDHVAAALHHEIAGLLLDRHPKAMSWTAWRQLSQPHASTPGEFSFLPDVKAGPADSHHAGEPPTLQELEDSLAQLGFLSSYGRTTEANDLEEYIRLLLQRPGPTLECARRHGIVRVKLGIALDFLRDASSGAMSREFLAGWMAQCGDPALSRDPSLLRVMDTGPPPG